MVPDTLWGGESTGSTPSVRQTRGNPLKSLMQLLGGIGGVVETKQSRLPLIIVKIGVDRSDAVVCLFS